MQICQGCQKTEGCRIPDAFARFRRVYDYLQTHDDGLVFLRERLEAFLHINRREKMISMRRAMA